MGTKASPVIGASDYTYENTRVVCSWQFMSMFLSCGSRISIAIRGLVPGDGQDVVPRGFSILSDFLKSEIEDYLVSGFGFQDVNHGMQSRLV